MITVRGIQRKIKGFLDRDKKRFARNIKLSRKTDDYPLKLMALRYLAHQLEKVIKHEYNPKVGLRGTDKSNDARVIMSSLKNTKYFDYPDVVWARQILEAYEQWCNHKTVFRKRSQNEGDLRKSNFLDIVHSRRSIRFWKKEKISREVIEDIIRTGIKAPSSCNRQTWYFTIVENRNTTNMSSKGVSNPQLIAKAPYILYISIDHRMYSEKYSPAIDAGLVTQNILLAMESYNISACPIYHSESYNQSLLRGMLGLSKSQYVYLALPFGYADETAVEPRRVVVNEILSFLELDDTKDLNVHY